MATETDDEFLVRRMREMKPLDSSGLSTTPKSPQTIKEMQGQTGGAGDYSVPPSPVQPVPNPDVSQPAPPLGTIPQVIFAFNGTLYYTTINGSVGDPV